MTTENKGLVFGSFDESRAVKEGQLLDIEKVRLRSYGKDIS